MRRLGLVLFCAAALAAGAQADVPLRVEQLIFSLTLYNGSDYSSTFALQTAGTIYLQAGVDNFVSLRKTLVYWWPLTAEWKTDTESLNQFSPGELELSGRAGTRKFSLHRYTYYSPATATGPDWTVATDAEADLEVARARAMADEYFASVEEFQRNTKEYDAKVEELGAKISERTRRGLDASGLGAQLDAVRRPAAPRLPDAYQVPPSQVQDGFIVNLSPGEYAARLVNPDGSILEGSDKKIIAYAGRRTGGVGYEVIPADKWTRPEESKTPSSVLYVNGSTDLYLRPFLEAEVNDLYYEKTVSNQATGNPSVYRWVRVRDVQDARLEIVTGSERVTAAAQELTVKQEKGTSLGYSIVPFDRKASADGAKPDMVAFHLPVPRQRAVIRYRSLNHDGRPVPGSERQVRVVSRSPLRPLLATLPALPILLLILGRIAGSRRRG
jgi:hypothetical protein